MKTHFGIMFALGVLCTLLVSCGDDGEGRKPNIFGDEESFVKVEYTSNADTVYLRWTLTDKDTRFDSYEVTDNRTGRVVTAGREATSCFLTHIPYAEPVSVYLSLVQDGKTVKTNRTDLVIDGLDRVTAGIIIPDRGSVTGGDGMYSVALPDGRSIFLMGDSYTGTVTGGRRSTSDHMYRNSYIVYDDGQVSALVDANGPGTSGAVPPGVTNEGQKWYWPGHGFVADNTLYIFQTVMYQGEEGMWGFRYETTDILEYELPEIRLKRTTRIPFTGSADIHYGMAALNDGDYIYIYAQVDVDNSANPVSEVLAARTTLDRLYDRWEYYTGTGWSVNSSDAVRLEGLASVPVSSQFNVFRLRDKYVLLTQNKRFNSGEIYTFVSDSPCGPWRNKQLIFETYEQDVPDLFTYNAMAHPQFEKDGMILVSYNVNTGDFAQQFSDVTTYRPRFFWVEIDRILNGK